MRSFLQLEDRLNRTISPHDKLYPVYAAQHGAEEYFRSGLRQLDQMDRLCREHRGGALEECSSAADFACHYGRLLRCLRAALPTRVLYACDLDAEAVAFCVQEFDCVPMVTSWHPREVEVGASHDLVVCVSLITHTSIDFLREVLDLWDRMLNPGGLLLFTFLGERYLDEWRAGHLAHYAPVDDRAREEAIRRFRRSGHAFCGYRSAYSEEQRYGIGFIDESLVRDEVARYPSLEFRAAHSGLRNGFGQDLAVVVKVSRGCEERP